MKKHLALLMLSSVFITTKSYAITCTNIDTEAKCNSLGYTMSAADCSGSDMLKCPLNLNKVWCGALGDDACTTYSRPFLNLDYCKGSSEGTNKTYYMPVIAYGEWNSLDIENKTSLPIPNNSRDTDCTLPSGATFLLNNDVCQDKMQNATRYGVYFGNIATSSQSSNTTFIDMGDHAKGKTINVIDINSLLVNDSFKIKGSSGYVEIGNLYTGSNLSSSETIQFENYYTYVEYGGRLNVDTLSACNTMYKSSTCPNGGSAAVIKLKNVDLEITNLGSSGLLCIEMDEDSIVTVAGSTKKYSDIESSSYNTLNQCLAIGTTSGPRVVCTDKGSGCSGYLTEYNLN